MTNILLSKYLILSYKIWFVGWKPRWSQVGSASHERFIYMESQHEHIDVRVKMHLWHKTLNRFDILIMLILILIHRNKSLSQLFDLWVNYGWTISGRFTKFSVFHSNAQTPFRSIKGLEKGKDASKPENKPKFEQEWVILDDDDTLWNKLN